MPNAEKAGDLCLPEPISEIIKMEYLFTDQKAVEVLLRNR